MHTHTHTHSHALKPLPLSLSLTHFLSHTHTLSPLFSLSLSLSLSPLTPLSPLSISPSRAQDLNGKSDPFVRFQSPDPLLRRVGSKARESPVKDATLEPSWTAEVRGGRLGRGDWVEGCERGRCTWTNGGWGGVEIMRGGYVADPLFLPSLMYTQQHTTAHTTHNNTQQHTQHTTTHNSTYNTQQHTTAHTTHNNTTCNTTSPSFRLTPSPTPSI